MELQELLIEMMTRKPELVHTTATSNLAETTSPRLGGGAVERTSFSALGGGTSGTTIYSASGGDTASITTVESDNPFVLVPPDPKLYYRRLFSVALDSDYDSLTLLPPDQDVSLTILSAIHERMLSECAVRWRIMVTLERTTFLQLVAEYYETEGFPEVCVAEAISGVERVAQDWNYDDWPWADVSLCTCSICTRW